jgi:hypothetical protein
MCNADVSAQGFDWFQELHYIWVRIDTVYHCPNFDRIRNWARKRSVAWNSHMAHVGEKTGRVIIDSGFVPDHEFVQEFTPKSLYYTKDDMYMMP